MPQGNHGIDTGGAQRGNDRGRQRYHRQGDGRDGQGGGIVASDGKLVAAFADNANAPQLNYVGTFTLKPGSYILTAARKAGSDTQGATETVTFEVK